MCFAQWFNFLMQFIIEAAAQTRAEALLQKTLNLVLHANDIMLLVFFVCVEE